MLRQHRRSPHRPRRASFCDRNLARAERAIRRLNDKNAVSRSGRERGTYPTCKARWPMRPSRCREVRACECLSR